MSLNIATCQGADKALYQFDVPDYTDTVEVDTRTAQCMLDTDGELSDLKEYAKGLITSLGYSVWEVTEDFVDTFIEWGYNAQKLQFVYEI